ncbi:MAG: SEC-C domain-containing protein [Fermentimonas sp.]
MLGKNIYFERELETVVAKFPQLRIKEEDNMFFLKGILDIPDDENNIVGSFAVEIYSTAGFPYRFPKLLEVGGDIPCEADWHKYSDNTCCLTVPANEILTCKNGITVLRFINEHAIPYFANQLYRKKTGKYLNEYSHGTKGIYEFYTNLFRSKDFNIWKKCLRIAMGNSKFERNSSCYCGSNIKYKKCHLLIEYELENIGWEQIKNDFQLMRLL